MAFAAKSLVFLKTHFASVSSKLSILALAGIVLVPLTSDDTPSRIVDGLRPPGPAAPIEVVQAKPVPLIEVPDADTLIEPAALRRSRPRREQEARGAPVRKDSAIAREDIPAPPSEAAQAEPPKPDVWSDADIIASLRDCLKLLAPISAEVDIAPPVKQNECGTAAPVMLRRVGLGSDKLDFNPPVMINCRMVVGLHEWVEKTLQPTAREALGTNIVRLRSVSSYSCRNRNGSTFFSDRLSEHAFANAIDIGAFVTADGRTIEVVRHWGPTLRDQREAERVAAARAKAGKRQAETVREAIRKGSAIAEKHGERRKGRDRALLQTAELQKLGRGRDDVKVDAQATPAAVRAEMEAAAKSPEGTFLRRLHKGACSTFGTVLGPEANEAHRDHFHFDMAARKRRAYCE